jgi:elongation factor Ts
MANITATQVNELRKATGAGMMACKKALVETDGDAEKATEILRKAGAAKAEKRADREVTEGTIGIYLHQNSKIAATVELKCETDFVARNDEFVDLAKKIAMQVAAMNPKFIQEDEVDQDTIEKEKVIWEAQLKEEGKPEEIIGKIIEGKVAKFNEENVLFKQKFFMDDSKTIDQLLVELSAKCGEKITLGRVTRTEI